MKILQRGRFLLNNCAVRGQLKPNCPLLRHPVTSSQASIPNEQRIKVSIQFSCYCRSGLVETCCSKKLNSVMERGELRQLMGRHHDSQFTHVCWFLRLLTHSDFPNLTARFFLVPQIFFPFDCCLRGKFPLRSPHTDRNPPSMIFSFISHLCDDSSLAFCRFICFLFLSFFSTCCLVICTGGGNS